MNNSETSIWWHIKSAWKKFVSWLLGKTSFFDITKIVSYNDLNWNLKENIPFLDGEKSHIYMWKMNEEEIWIYSDDFLKWILQYYFYCTPKWENITLELANCVSEVLWENMQWFMNFTKQKEYIQNFVEKNFSRKDTQRLEIIDLESRHPELFTQLRKYEKKIKTEAVEKWLSIWELDQTPSFDNLEFLDSDKSPKLPDYEFSFSSLDIAKYLYRVCKNNALFFDKIKAIKPEKAKSEFYPIIEIALRLTDFLNWVDIQWWAIKQKNYDAIIREIINPYKNISQYPEIAQLREFCKQRIWERSFETIYMDGNSKKYRSYTDKINQEKLSSSKIRIYSAITALALLWILWTPKLVDYYKTEKLKKQTQKNINEIFENKRLTYSWEYWRWEYVEKEKTERISMYINNIYNRFQVRYWAIDEDQEIWFRSKIVDCINNQKILDMLWSYTTYWSTTEDIVIDQYFIPQNLSEFQTLNIPTIPYQKYIEYTDDFINTLLLEWDFKAKWDTASKSMGYRWMTNTMKLLDEIGPYCPRYQTYEPSITEAYQLARMKHNWKYLVLATRAFYDYESTKRDDGTSYFSGLSIKNKLKKNDEDILSTSIAKDLAIDFLKQTNPVINALLDQYLLRYFKYYGNSLSMLEDGTFVSDKHELNIRTEEIIIKEFLKKWLIKKIWKNDIAKLNNFLDELILSYWQDLKINGRYWRGDIVENLLPNWHFQEYEEAIRNTLTDTTWFLAERKNSYIKPRSDDEPLAFDKSLGKYIDSKGKKYLLWLTSYKWKNYLCAREESPSDYYSWRYYTLECAKLIAKDYFQTKSDFLQKKLLHEKKLKSASQRHEDRPLKNDSIPKNNLK